MHKWPFISVISLILAGPCAQALAANAEAILPTNDTMGCTSLIQQGDVVPPVATNDLITLQNCMKSCDTLYKALGQQGRTVEMIYGTNYCRKSLNNLYFASVTQTITNQLDQQTKQQRADEQAALQNKLTNIKEPLQQKTQSTVGVTQTDKKDDTGGKKATPTNSTPINLDNIKW